MAVWSTVITEPGEQCVVMDGMKVMQEQFVVSWGSYNPDSMFV